MIPANDAMGVATTNVTAPIMFMGAVTPQARKQFPKDVGSQVCLSGNQWRRRRGLMSFQT